MPLCPPTIPLCLFANWAARRIYVEPTFDVRITTNVTYAQGLTCAENFRTHCKPMDVKLDVYEPVTKAGGPMVPALKPAFMYSHGSNKEEADPIHQEVVLFWARRGFVAFGINYRQEHDHGLVPISWQHVFDPEQLHRYPHVRDSKAAVRYVRANAAKYGVDSERVVVSGSSTGGSSMVAAGIAFEGDYKDELSVDEDPTLASTHMNFSSHPQCMVAFWSSRVAITRVQEADPLKRNRYSSNNTPIIAFNGDQDTTVPITYTKLLQEEYRKHAVDFELHVLKGCGHIPWCYDGNSTCECDPEHPPDYAKVDYFDPIALPFVAKHLNLEVVGIPA